MAEHCDTVVLPTRTRKPRDKAKVENGVLQAERWILAPLRKQTFHTLGELRRAIAERLEWLNNRPLSKLDGTRRSLWRELDRPALKPLPATATTTACPISSRGLDTKPLAPPKPPPPPPIEHENIRGGETYH